MTKASISIDGSLSNICTALVKQEQSGALIEGTSGGWAYYGLYGNQSYIGDGLGVAIFYRTADLAQTTEDSLNYLVVLNPSGGELVYYFASAWVQDTTGINSSQAWESYMQEMVQMLDAPLTVEIQ